VQRSWSSTAGGVSVTSPVSWVSIHETLRNWVAAERQQRSAGPAALGADERLELARLRRKVAELELEREILTTAAVFVARETGR
jgi:transposase